MRGGNIWLLRYLLCLLFLVEFNLVDAQLCTGSLGDPVVKLDFGSGTALNGGALGSGITSYTYQSAGFPMDGYYSVTNSTAGLLGEWWSTTDHTGNSGGYMMVVNASLSLTDYFYKKSVTGLCAGTTYEFSAWVLNLFKVATRPNPNLTFKISDNNGVLLGSYTTGSIPANTSSVIWKQFGFFFTATTSDVVITIINNTAGAAPGNDLALDDIAFRPCGATIQSAFADGTVVQEICEKPAATLQCNSTFGGTVAATAFQWQKSADNGVSWTDISGATSAGLTLTNLSAGTYLYRVATANSSNISSLQCRVVSNTLKVIVHPNPAPVISGNNPTCYGDTLWLQTSAAASYNWTGPNGFTASDQNPVITNLNAASNGTYYLSLTSVDGCTGVDSIKLAVYPAPTANAGSDRYVCKGIASVQLNASGGTSYNWSPAAGLSAANIANPVASPTVTTNYVVTVSVTGCNRTKSDTVQVLVRPPLDLQLPNDTLICSIDTLRLNASGAAGVITWSPAYSISNVHSYTPLVSPDVPTWYYATLTAPDGCYNNDSVFVDVRTYISVYAGADSTICLGDTIQLHPQSEALQYVWSTSSSGYISSTTQKFPLVVPNAVSQTYHVIANLGKCQSQDDVTIYTVPYPGRLPRFDTTVCSAQLVPLKVTGGSRYQWAPATFLTDATSAQTIAVKPTAPGITYVVAVRDVLGCPKPVYDTLHIQVIAPLQVDAGPSDTTIVNGQPLQLQAVGSDLFEWTPSTGLSNTRISNPVATPESDITYYLTTRSLFGCTATDSIHVRIYNVTAGFYIPTAFSPNGDGLNDLFKPILLGMKSLNQFLIYNRYGQVVYATQIIGQGWDGRFKGNPQDPGAFVWMIDGIDYTGKKVFQKGTVVLVR